MASIGQYVAPNQGIRNWITNWMHNRVWTSPRLFLSQQLKYIRKHHGTKQALEFRNYLIWLGVYPAVRKSKADPM